MKTSHFFLFTFFLFIFVNTIQAQNNTYTLTGTIIDNHSNLPLFYVNAGLLSEVDSAVVSVASTDKEGIFTFLNVKSGNYIIKTSYIGYDIFQQPLSVVGENREIILDTIRLQPSASMLQNVTIATTKPVFMNDGEKILYNVSEDPSVQTGTAADALQNAPGVEVDIEGNITLRGVSSVEIWINGRPSRLNEENLKTYIQQLPANALERIEVINNPSARYSASGTGGIINIVTKAGIKKNSFISFGLNGSTRPMASPWFSYMYSNEKFSINVYANGYYNFWKSKSNGYNIILNENMDTSSYRSFTKEERSNSIHTNLWVSGSYNFDSLKTISFWGGCWGMPFNKGNASDDYEYREFINNPGVYDYMEEYMRNYTAIGGNFGIGYEHNFNNEGHKLVAEIYGGIYNNTQVKSFQRYYDNYPELNKDKKSSRSFTGYSAGIEMNYSLPYIKNGLIEIGVEGNYWYETDVKRNDTLSHLSPEVYILDSMRYLNFKSNEGDLNVYITIEHKFGNFTIKGGLRSENRLLNYTVINQPEHHGTNIYPGLYPSLHLSYATKSMHNFNLSYTRRVRYPWAMHINTFITYDEDSFSTGNPNIKSTYTNSVEGGWTKYFDKFGSVGISAYFKNNKDEINDLTDVVYNDFFKRMVSFSMPVNSGKSHRYGADVNVMYKLKAFMSIRLNASIYQSHSETVFREDEKAITDFFTYSFRLNFWAKVWKYLEINASGNYRSKTKTIFFEEHPSYSINCGLRSDFWDKKISVFLNVQDIFNWGKYGNTNTNPYYIAYNSTKYNSRFISAGVTFRFGKIEMESKARTGGNTE